MTLRLGVARRAGLLQNCSLSAGTARPRAAEALGSVLELIADRFQADEVTRYEGALRGNAAYLTSLDAPTRCGRGAYQSSPVRSPAADFNPVGVIAYRVVVVRRGA
jgi:hypothetical protein